VSTVGTQIVSRTEVKDAAGELLCLRGAVGAIVESPTDNSHRYQIQLANGIEVHLKRHEFTIRKHFQKEGCEWSDNLRNNPFTGTSRL
jgi:hypothetical protein